MSYAQDILRGKYKIPISALGEFDYCPHSIYLKFVEGIKPQKNEQIRKGEEIHASLDQEYFSKGEMLSLEEALEKSTTTEKVFVIRAVTIENKILKGIVDEIEISKEQIRIIDDKPIKENRIWHGMKLQIYGYCTAYEDTHDLDRDLYACIRNRDSREIVLQELFENKHREEVNKVINQMLDIFSGKIEPKGSESAAKCKVCRYNIYCSKKLDF
ncbi:MAG: CRISPR-associated protein Cas4 [Candidatus Nanoarchaeia archaeon]